ncbi:MAG TPA: hypothetical protein VFX17_01685 [Patescibacteria group bacterium]|nr:hypothetical protein [Patescibacteria group bacterium]
MKKFLGVLIVVLFAVPTQVSAAQFGVFKKLGTKIKNAVPLELKHKNSATSDSANQQQAAPAAPQNVHVVTAAQAQSAAVSEEPDAAKIDWKDVQVVQSADIKDCKRLGLMHFAGDSFFRTSGSTTRAVLQKIQKGVAKKGGDTFVLLGALTTTNFGKGQNIAADGNAYYCGAK